MRVFTIIFRLSIDYGVPNERQQIARGEVLIADLNPIDAFAECVIQPRNSRSAM